jgi:hypothetical protein
VSALSCFITCSPYLFTLIVHCFFFIILRLSRYFRGWFGFRFELLVIFSLIVYRGKSFWPFVFFLSVSTFVFNFIFSLGFGFFFFFGS